jgi:hypothetical protein
MRYNRVLLKKDIATDTTNIRALKKLRGESFQPHFGWKEHRDLKDLKRRATIRCSVAAHLRGRIHLAGTTAEDQAKLIEKVLPQYALPEQETAAA